MDRILVASINKKLEDNFGKMVDSNLPLFRVLWTTGVTEKRFSQYHDFIDDNLIRVVEEVREVLKYPFAQDRYCLERIQPISDKAREMGLVASSENQSGYSYEEVYLFQDRLGRFLPLTYDKVEEALYLFFVFYLQKTPKERIDMRMKMLADRELAKKEITRGIVGEKLPAPHSLGVLDLSYLKKR